MASRALDTSHDGLGEQRQCTTDGCGFYANEATEGLCSQCFKAKMSAIQLKVDAAGAAASEGARQAAALSAAPSPAASAAAAAAPEVDARQSGGAGPDVAGPRAVAAAPVAQAAAVDDAAPAPEPPKKKNRCAICNKKVGLMGFECKCGRLLCTAHRQAEEHQCDFDYRAEGKKKLEAANPQISFQKVENI